MLRTGQISLLKSLSDLSIDTISQSTSEKLTVNTKAEEKNETQILYLCMAEWGHTVYNT